MRIRAVVLAVVLAVFGLSAHSADAETRPAQVTLDQVRGLARQAFLTGNSALANQLAHILLRANENDVAALILLAATEPLTGRVEEGIAAGKLAWKLAEVDGLKHEAAYYTARAALFDKSFTQAKFWLRRAYQTSKSETQQARLAHDFKRIRAVSPWQGNLSASITPSSNLNGGSQWDWLLIDDLYIVGPLSGDAQALSGWRASLHGSLAYRLSRSERQETKLRFTGYHSFNFLSSEAQALAPNFSGSNLNNASAEIALEHRRDVGALPVPDRASLSFGYDWYGGSPLASHAALRLSRDIRMANGQTTYRFSGEVRRNWRPDFTPESLRLGLDGNVVHELGNGDQLRFGLGIEQTQAAARGKGFTQASARLSYTFAKPIAHTRATLKLGLRGREYPEFFVGPFPAPNGREDIEISGALSLAFEDLDYMGFTPVLTLSAAQTRSNITRFESKDIGVSVGFKSSF